MSSHLYGDCSFCKGVGRVTIGATRGFPFKPRQIAHPMDSDGLLKCPACEGAKVVRIGLTVAQLERIVAENHRLKALVVAPAPTARERKPGDLAWIDDLVDDHGGPPAEEAWRRIKSDLARDELARRAEGNRGPDPFRHCPSCGAPSLEPAARSRLVGLYRCRGCDFVFAATEGVPALAWDDAPEPASPASSSSQSEPQVDSLI